MMKPLASILAIAIALVPGYAFASPDSEVATLPASSDTPAPQEKAPAKKHSKKQHAKAPQKTRAHAQKPAIVPISTRTTAKPSQKETKSRGAVSHKKVEKNDKGGDKHPAEGEPHAAEPRHGFAPSRHVESGSARHMEKRVKGIRGVERVRLEEPDKHPGKGKPAARTASTKKERAPKVEPSKVEPPKPCLADAVEILRGAEADTFSLATCDGGVAPLALERLSVLLRPGGERRPEGSLDDLARASAKKGEIAPRIRKVDPGLVSRLAQIVGHLSVGGKAKIHLVSGVRPASAGSLHQVGRAIDFRIEGIDNEKVVELCRTMADTGCGYYPNSSFAHVDVRDPGTGHVHWIDASRPGEPPRYVQAWPEAKAEPETPPALPEGKDAPVEHTP
jgi:hypothetical protein